MVKISILSRYLSFGCRYQLMNNWPMKITSFIIPQRNKVLIYKVSDGFLKTFLRYCKVLFVGFAVSSTKILITLSKSMAALNNISYMEGNQNILLQNYKCFQEPVIYLGIYTSVWTGTQVQAWRTAPRSLF